MIPKYKLSDPRFLPESAGAPEGETMALNRVIDIIANSAIDVDTVTGKITPRCADTIDKELSRFRDRRGRKLRIDREHCFFGDPVLALIAFD